MAHTGQFALLRWFKKDIAFTAQPQAPAFV
jgi:hypothetical protein